MTEQQEVRLRLSMPDEWTLEHWSRYNSGRQELIARARERKETPDNLTVEYYGAKALIDSGYVRLEGEAEAVAKAKAMLAVQSPPLSFVGFLNREVANKIEEAFDIPVSF